jgi:hypothetical protein
VKTWGIGIFDNEVAQRVRGEFTAAVNDGLSVFAAADRIQKAPSDPLQDSQRPQLYLALAACQLEHGLISPKLKKQALTVINLGEDDENWISSPPETRAARKEVLDKLRQRLLETDSGIG